MPKKPNPNPFPFPDSGDMSYPNPDTGKPICKPKPTPSQPTAKRRDRTFTDADILRIYCNNLDKKERLSVLENIGKMVKCGKRDSEKKDIDIKKAKEILKEIDTQTTKDILFLLESLQLFEDILLAIRDFQEIIKQLPFYEYLPMVAITNWLIDWIAEYYDSSTEDIKKKFDDILETIRRLIALLKEK